jgi:hypothetical protein
MHEGWTNDGKMLGKHVGCGNIPTFIEEMKRAKMNIDLNIFADGRN